ncbi:MAG: hypothetical protein L6Q97_01960 [Thermoanaerobaculia bacterium]|nr:hypothetical protein [Thermoanaerobaculia bacterium]
MSNRPSGIEIPQTSQPQIPAPFVKGVKIHPPHPRFDRDVSDGGGERFMAFFLAIAVAGLLWVFFF